jgi:hypothetical protein
MGSFNPFMRVGHCAILSIIPECLARRILMRYPPYFSFASIRTSSTRSLLSSAPAYYGLIGCDSNDAEYRETDRPEKNIGSEDSNWKKIWASMVDGRIQCTNIDRFGPRSLLLQPLSRLRITQQRVCCATFRIECVRPRANHISLPSPSPRSSNFLPRHAR